MCLISLLEDKIEGSDIRLTGILLVSILLILNKRRKYAA